MLHIFYGPDSYSLKEALDQLRAELGESDLLNTGISHLEGSKLTPGELQVHCDALPFLAPKRLVMVEGLLARFEPRRAEGMEAPQPTPQSQFIAQLQGYLPQMPPTTELALVDGDISPRNPLLRALAPLAQEHKFPNPSKYRLPQWVQDRARREGGAISEKAAQLLAELVGPNLWVLASEVQKLCLYASGRTIQEDDVRLLTSQAQEPGIYSLTDAVLEGNIPAASRHLHPLLDSGAQPAYILFRIARQFRLVLQAQEMGGQAMSTVELAQRLGQIPEFAARKAQAQARRYPPGLLEAAYPLLLKADLAIKTGRLPGDMALDLLLGELGALARP
ncbi:MAG: DNA polymerase III subunit delta [Chloroflexi bacterium]|nr:DNA polymerase III subunit delta [Chloroflexota bacterium]